MPLNEADTRAKLVDPAIKARGWTEDPARDHAGRQIIWISEAVSPFLEGRGFHHDDDQAGGFDELLSGLSSPEDLTGDEGLFMQLKKALRERALGAELTHHLGYEKGDPAGRKTGNSRSGHSSKTVLTEDGTMETWFVARNTRDLSTILGFSDLVSGKQCFPTPPKPVRSHPTGHVGAGWPQKQSDTKAALVHRLRSGYWTG